MLDNPAAIPQFIPPSNFELEKQALKYGMKQREKPVFKDKEPRKQDDDDDDSGESDEEEPDLGMGSMQDDQDDETNQDDEYDDSEEAEDEDYPYANSDPEDQA